MIPIRLLAIGAALFAGGSLSAEPWKRHAIDPGRVNGLSGADGVRLGDANSDGLMDTVTGWEEGKAIRVCLHPGHAKAKQPWPSVTVSRVPSAEDAVFADLDGDGNLDVVSCTEGRNKTVYFHWAPKAKGDYLKEAAWKTDAVPATAKKESWMFAVPMDIDGKNGIDLIVASKGKASVSWLESPADPRDVSAWKLHKIVDAGWIMTLRSERDDAKLAPVYVTDRKGKTRGVFKLVPSRASDGAVAWTRQDLGGKNHEVMFMDVWPANRKPLVSTRNKQILDFSTDPPTAIPNPFAIPHGKAVRIGDLDGDGRPDIVHTSNTGKQKNAPGVALLKKVDGKWTATDIGGPEGSKFDRIELMDVDGDGDLDVLTCEENAGQKSMGLGLVWYENPSK